jgi:GTPase SAR1 family protein
LTSNRKVSYEEAASLAAKWNISYIESSAKTRENVDKAFSEIFVKIKDLKAMRRAQNGQSNNVGNGNSKSMKLTKEEEEAIRADSMRKRIQKFYKNAKKRCLLM